MPKIFLIKNRLHQQQLRLLEAQNLLAAKDEDRLGGLATNNHGSEPSNGGDCDEPLPLVAKKKDKTDSGEFLSILSLFKQKTSTPQVTNLTKIVQREFY